MPSELSFSNRHKDLAARDREYVLGWRFNPGIVFERGEGVRLFDVDGNAYYDMSAGMMSLTRRWVIPFAGSWLMNPQARAFLKTALKTPR